MTTPEWMTDALCAQVDPELFFPEKGGSVKEAKLVCAACPVRSQCLDYAMKGGYEITGVWGGTSSFERRNLTTRREPFRRTPADVANRARELVAAGCSYAEVGRQLNLARQTVRFIAQRSA